MLFYMLCDFTGWSSKTSFMKEMVISSIHSHLHGLVMKMNESLNRILGTAGQKQCSLSVHNYGLC